LRALTQRVRLLLGGASVVRQALGMLAKPHRYALDIIERHLDTFGHVNNAVYLEIFEEARWDWITRNGYGMKEIRELGQGPTILGCSLKFMKELTLRERIEIESDLTSVSGKTFEVVQRIRRPDGEIACEAQFKMGLFDLRARRLVEPTPRWLAGLGLDSQAARTSS
jgi:thioesterase-3